MESEKVKLGLVGLGKMGQRHLEKLINHSGVEISGLFDVDSSRCLQIANQYQLRSFQNLDELFFNSDAVMIAASTSSHFEIARKAISHELAVFIEKPICHSVEKAEQIVRLAREKKCLIQTGFVERYSWKKLLELKPDWFAHRPQLISTERCSSQPSRERGLDIVSDLMIHDIDFVLWSLREPPITIASEGVSVGCSPIDIAFARLEFASGAVAYLKAAWVLNENKRFTQISSGQSSLGFDLKNREAKYFGNGELSEGLNLSELDPLSEQLDSFVGAIKGKENCVVKGIDGLKALEISELIKQQILSEEIKRTTLSDRERRFLFKSWSSDAN